MKRRLCIVAVFLLAGVVVNVSVAWACAAWSRVEGAPYTESLFRLIGDRTIVDSAYSGVGLRIDFVYTKGIEYNLDLRVTSGWPLLATSQSSWKRYRIRGLHDAPYSRDTYRLGSIEQRRDLEAFERSLLTSVIRATQQVTATRRRAFATDALWLGFVVNTLFYATVLWLLICCPFAIQRYIRIRRGRCAKCAYPMGEADVCSECGNAAWTHECGDMKRRLLMIAIFLFAGAVVNMAVACGCAYIGTKYDTHKIEVVLAPKTCGVLVLTAFGREFVAATLFMTEERVLGGGRMGIEIEAYDRAHDWSITRQSGLLSDDGERLLQYEEASGWPQLCLRLYAGISSGASGTFGCRELGGPRRYALSSGMTFFPPGGERTLPLIPIARGFVINTIFYAAVLWLLIGGSFALRRFIRMKRGRCPKCAYPMGESAVCSECGKPIPGRMAVTT